MYKEVNMNLPIEFKSKMKKLLSKNEYNEFIDSFDKDYFVGIRVNRLKISVEEFKKITPFELKEIPWTKDGFYIDSTLSPGKHPYYYAGLYYIQEPSAMFPVCVLNVSPGEKILDLCSAPGGKAVQVASDMEGKGLLFVNDTNKTRIKALVKNVELFGLKNTIVLNEEPDNLSVKFDSYFDKILVDAPCSGEGMFRKDKEAVKSWENYNSAKCIKIQKSILRAASRMLKPGGKIVYSTCTFAPEENECIIAQFLSINPEFELINIEKIFNIDSGNPKWADGVHEVTKTARLWPHKINGEGHFTALISKKNFSIDNSNCMNNINEKNRSFRITSLTEKELSQVNVFIEKNLNLKLDGYIYKIGDNLYHLDYMLPNLDNLKVVKFGLYLGKIERNIYIPSHTFIISLSYNNFRNRILLESSSDDVNKYLKGETLIIDKENGFYGVFVDNYILGSAKCIDGTLKNMYPKGWRKQN